MQTSLVTAWAVTGVVGMASLGCAGSMGAPASKPAVVFPSRDEIARLPSLPPRAEAFGKDALPVDAWGFEAQAASDAAAYDDPSPWGNVVRELVKGHEANVTPSTAMRCAAEELARFHLKNAAMPTESLRRFTVARCGSIATAISPLFYTVTTPGPVKDEDLADKALAAFAKHFGDRLGSGHHLLGVAARRDAKHATIVAVLAQDEARLEPGTFGVGPDRRVTLRGAARGAFTEIGAMVNRGDVGTASCVADPQVKAPRFALTCELGAHDAFAWVEMFGRKQGQLLVHELGETLIHEGDGSAIAYSARHVGPPAPVTGPADFTRALLDRLNHVRTGAHMEPLALAPDQSTENTRLAGTLIDASSGGDDETANRAAIGLMAGWDVRGLVRNGSFFLAAVGPTTDATAWLDFALERPMGRMTLLDPGSRQIAIGPALPPGGGALGAAVTTYAMFGSEDHTGDADRFFHRIVAARAAHGLPPPVRLPAPEPMSAELASVLRQGKAPMDALNASMHAAVESTGQGVRGYVLETNDLDAAGVPDPLLAPGPLRVMVGVTHHRAEGAAWGQYVVIVVVEGSGATGQTVASSDRPSRHVE